MAESADELRLSEQDGGTELLLKVVPGASSTRIVGVWRDALRVAVAAPPEGGKANKMVVELLARTFQLKKADVAIVRGQTNPLKTVHLSGMKAEDARRRLESLLSPR